MLTRIVKINFQAHFVEQFKNIFNDVRPQIVASTGCIGVKLLQDQNNHTILFTISYWENEDALTQYRNSDLFKITWSKIKPHFESKAEAWSLLEY